MAERPSQASPPEPRPEAARPRTPATKHGSTAAALAALGLMAAVAWLAIRSHDLNATPASANPSAASPPPRTAGNTPPSAPAEPVTLRPLPVARRSASHEWTAGDGADPDVITRIAHNPDEFIRMVGENERIIRRQLVYRNDTAAAVVQRARAAGEPVRQLTLPALDGLELEFVVTRSDLTPEGLSGTFTGHLADRPDSLVTLAFKGGREAFSVSSPGENLHLQADPREPGEIIVKHIDPATYIEGTCGNPGR